jgi:hypothetical protein
VKKEGTIVVFGQFPEGVGDRFYQEWLGKPLSEILALKPNEIRLGVHSAYLMARNLAWAEIVLFTELDNELATRLHFRKVQSMPMIEQYLENKHGAEYHSFIIPNGSQILIEFPR